MSYPHPYQPELDRYEPDDALLSRVEPQTPGPMEGDAVWVDDKESLAALVHALKDVREIAIDLEAHGCVVLSPSLCLSLFASFLYINIGPSFQLEHAVTHNHTHNHKQNSFRPMRARTCTHILYNNYNTVYFNTEFESDSTFKFRSGIGRTSLLRVLCSYQRGRLTISLMFWR